MTKLKILVRNAKWTKVWETRPHRAHTHTHRTRFVCGMCREHSALLEILIFRFSGFTRILWWQAISVHPLALFAVRKNENAPFTRTKKRNRSALPAQLAGIWALYSSLPLCSSRSLCVSPSLSPPALLCSNWETARQLVERVAAHPYPIGSLCNYDYGWVQVNDSFHPAHTVASTGGGNRILISFARNSFCT